MTDFTVSALTTVVAENLEWDLTPPHGRVVIAGTLAVASLTQAQHYPDGFLKSGAILSLATTGTYNGFLVPYLNAATAGTGDVATGVLVASVPVQRISGVDVARTRVGVALMVRGVVSQSKLPYTSGNAAAGGYIDAAGKADLPAIIWNA